MLFSDSAVKCASTKYYKGPLECVIDIVRTQGVLGLYKGFWTLFAR